MLRRIHRFLLLIEIVLFVISAGALAFFSEMHEWKIFFPVVAISGILFSILQALRSRPVNGKARSI